MTHVPVLLQEVIDGLALRPGDDAIDCTYGCGGYTNAMLAASAPDGRVLGIDRDTSVHAASVDQRLVLVHANFDHIGALAAAYGYVTPRAIVADLGFSSLQVFEPSRGFSFQHDGPLDMRYNTTGNEQTAADLIANLPMIEIERIIRLYGEDRHARVIAAVIIEERRHRRIETTQQLVDVIQRALPKRGRIHPATRTFQALRIAVNDELGALERAIPQMIELVQEGGRIAIVSFHSLEDRIVKQVFRAAEDQRCGVRITKRPLQPSEQEIEHNPRSRSAKLRIFEKQSS
ncbi:MAG: 16S rRNA (cytosine(1402)-N(4))-methyltransferase RsmH [Candidatus Uhrbacteria bacterium]